MRTLRGLCSLVLAFFSCQLFAQQGAVGTVTGRVSNQATKDLLPGAIVAVEDTNLSTTSGRDGTFRIEVPAGSRTLTISFTGLDTARIPVEVEAGGTIAQNVQLTSSIYLLDAVTVTGLREGNARALQLQRETINAKTVAATDTFGNPAANPGELLQRLPGVTATIVGSEVRTVLIRGMAPTFSNLMVDGNKVATSAGSSGSRDYQIEQMGTGNIEQIEIIKAPTPDMDASAVAGYINLVSKRAFDLPGRRISVTAGTLWKVRGDGVEGPFEDNADNLDLLTFSYSDVFSVGSGQNNLGIAFNANYRVGSTVQDEVGAFFTGGAGAYVFNTDKSRTLQSTFGTGDIGYDAVSFNTSLNVDYKANADTYVYLKTAFNSNKQYQEYIRQQVSAPANSASFAAGSTFEQQTVLPVSTATLISSIFPKFSSNYQISGGLERKLLGGDGQLDFRASYSYADIDYPNYVDARAAATGIGWQLDRRGRDEWLPAFTQTAGASLSDPASYRPTAYFQQNQRSPNELKSTRLDFRKDIDTVVPAYIKVGVKYDHDTREPQRNQSNFTWAGPSGIGSYVGYPYSQAYGTYGPFPFLQLPGTGKQGDITLAPAGSWIKTASDAYNDVVQSRSADAKLTEAVKSAYVSSQVTIGDLRVLAGVRVEQTETEIDSWTRSTSAANGTTLDPTLSPAANTARALASFTGRKVDKHEYQNVFPGLHFVYEPADGWQLRTSYNASIARPPVANLLPLYVVNPDAGTISGGNPELRPFKADNFEFSVQKFFEPVGMFEVSFFLKEIKDYFRNIATVVGTGPDNGFDGLYAGYTLNSPQNTGRARIRGVDLAYQQQFSFLPGAFRGLGFQASYTYQEAEGDFGTTNSQAQLAGFTPRSANAGLTYVGYGVDARLLANYRSNTYMAGAGLSSLYQEERVLLDLKLQYTIDRTYQVFLDVTNLTDEPTRTDVMENDIKYFAGWNGIGFTAGVRARF